MALALEPTDPESALRHLRALTRLRPRDSRIQNDLAEFYLRRGQPTAALQEIELARRDPDAADNPTLDLSQALAYLNLNRFQDAEPLLRRYLEAAPDDARAHFLMGHLLWQLGNPAEARPHLEFARARHFQPPAGVLYPDQPLSQP
jgi:Flp pilus assembly protein TadD